MALKNLEGVSQETVPHTDITKAADVKDILRLKQYGTAAGNSGAINVYKDDDGFIRCEAMRLCKVIDKKIFDTVDDAIQWTRIWLKKIK